jgi:hypothetical protein
MQELSSKLVNLEKKLDQVSATADKLTNDLLKRTQDLDEATKKYMRAEQLAAHLERQFKEAKPNTKIDYFLLSDAEPSTQLLAALMAKAPPTKIEKLNSGILPVLTRRLSKRPSIMTHPSLKRDPSTTQVV